MQIHRSTDPSRPQARTLAVLVSLACLHMVPAHAQSTAPRNAHAALPEVVVSGSRQEQAADELPLSYDVINANTLSNQQSRNLREALENLPNTSVKRSPARFSVGGATASAGRDGNVGINIRGLGGNRVLMLVMARMGIGAPRLVLAIARHRSPGELERQEHQQQEGEQAAQHGADVSRACPTSRIRGITDMAP